MSEPTRIMVHASRPYEVVVGNGVTTELNDLIGPDAVRVAVLHTAPLRPVVNRMREALQNAGLRVTMILLPDGEAAKRLEVAGTCWSALGQAGFTRSDVVVAVGGGSVTDLAGFVAAGWLRGVRVVHVSTTVLGMVDAAIGGKTAINIVEGKNLVGAFHDPAGVVCDLNVLSDLPRDEIISGLAEVIKCGFIADPTILADVEADPAAATDPARTVLRSLIERAIRVKVAVVTADPHETDRSSVGREVLNYGHTLGHAIERVEQYRWRHGAAVSVGLVYAAELGRLSGRLDVATADRHRALLDRIGLPTAYRRDAWPDLLAAMRVDKKARGDQLRFIVLDGLARPGVLDGPSADLLNAAFDALG